MVRPTPEAQAVGVSEGLGLEREVTAVIPQFESCPEVLTERSEALENPGCICASGDPRSASGLQMSFRHITFVIEGHRYQFQT